jgi:hypothetical protein
MDGWIVRWMDGWMDGWYEEVLWRGFLCYCTDSLTDRHTDRLTVNEGEEEL